MPKIDIVNVTKNFPETKKTRAVTALDNVSVSIDNGALAVILGSSGCGKTTLLRCISGLEDFEEGSILFDGKDVTDLAPKDRNIAYVSQNYVLYPHMSVYDNIAFPLKIMRTSPKEIETRVEDVADLLGIKILLSRKPKMLSGGQQQRVALARAIVKRPDLYLFDEPLSSLDTPIRIQLRHLLLDIHKKLNATFIFVTHDQTEAMTLATQLIVMSDAKIEQAAPPLEVFNSPANKFVYEFMHSGTGRL